MEVHSAIGLTFSMDPQERTLCIHGKRTFLSRFLLECHRKATSEMDLGRACSGSCLVIYVDHNCLFPDGLLAIIANLRNCGFSCFYFDLSDSDTSEKTAVARYTESPLILLGLQLGRIFTLLTFSHTWRQRKKA